MKNTKVWGWIALVITIVYTCVGLPMQIFKNFHDKSVSGISLLMISLSFSAFAAWGIYGTLKRDWYILCSNIMGVICTGIILLQFYFYS